MRLFGLFLALFVAFAPAADAQQNFAPLAQRLMPSVVAIDTSQRVEADSRFRDGSPLEDFNALLDQGGRRVTSLGSGFIIAGEGIIVTNNHVIEGADEIVVILNDGARFPAQLIGRDPAIDVAVLRINAGRPLPAVAWGDSDSAQIGEWVMAIGNPFGLGASVSVGVISARNRNISAGLYDDFIQTDAAINRGSSGGPLFNTAGQVVGINTAIVSPTGQSVGVGFATPSDLARPVVEQIIKFGEARRGWIGVRTMQVTPEIAARLNLERPAGALVRSVARDGPAERAGLRQNDLILRYDGREISEARLLTRLIAETEPGRAVVVEFSRAGQRRTATINVLKLAASPAQAETAEPGAPPAPQPSGATGRVIGIGLAELTPQLRRANELAPGLSGVMVTDVLPGYDAAAKLKRGDVILEVGFQPVMTIGQIRALSERAERAGQPLLLRIQRDGRESFRAIRPRRN